LRRFSQRCKPLRMLGVSVIQLSQRVAQNCAVLQPKKAHILSDIVGRLYRSLPPPRRRSHLRRRSWGSATCMWMASPKKNAYCLALIFILSPTLTTSCLSGIYWFRFGQDRRKTSPVGDKMWLTNDRNWNQTAPLGLESFWISRRWACVPKEGSGNRLRAEPAGKPNPVFGSRRRKANLGNDWVVQVAD